jgi:3-methyladenine DNA glycosylase AlkC
LGIEKPARAFPAIRRLAASSDWKVREVAATVLVRVGKKHPQAVLTEMKKWSKSTDENIRRASSEGLRGIARIEPGSVMPVLENLRHDPSVYVRKSVANILRDATKKNPDVVMKTCLGWLRGATESTRWILKNGIKKLPEEQQRSILSRIE